MRTLSLLVLCFLTAYTSATCVKKLNFFQNLFSWSRLSRKGEWSVLQQIICQNIMSDLVLDFEYVDTQYPQELVIRTSSIPKIPANSSLSKFTTIKALDLSNVGVEEIEPGAFDGLVKLEKLDVSFNKLSKIPAGVFSNLKTLRRLYIYNNRINEIEDDGFEGLSSLEELFLNGNQLSSLNESLFSSLESLENLWVSENPLVEFSVSTPPKLLCIIADKTDIKKLNVNFTELYPNIVNFTRSRLEDLNLESFSRVPSINFDHNNITSVQNWHKSKSMYISLRYNNLTIFDIPANVELLSLSHNKIHTFGNTLSDKEKHLRELDLSYNNISNVTSIVFKGLTNLQILNLSHNKISYFRENTFIECPILRQLYLSSNEIELIQPGTFNSLVNFEFLDISDNNLKILIPPVLSEIKKANVVVGQMEIEWGYMKTLIKGSEDLSIQINKQFWNCSLDHNGNGSVDIKYITKSNVDTIVCYFKK